MSTKTKKLGKLHVCVGLFLAAFILVILHVGWFFGEFAFWLCFYSICFFQCVAETNFLCWSWCRNTRANESHWISCVSNHISSYFTPKCIQRRGEPVPPFIHTFLNFYFSWSKTYCKVFLFWFKKDLHKDLIGFCVYPTTSNHVQSLVISNQERYSNEGWACHPHHSYIFGSLFSLVTNIIVMWLFLRFLDAMVLGRPAERI